MIPMLEWDQERRATAQECLDHPWFSMPPNEEFKMSEKQHDALILKKKLWEIDAGEDDAPQPYVESLMDGEADCEDNLSWETPLQTLLD